jgi:tetratricopeptide (TPR) repeat protein
MSAEEPVNPTYAAGPDQATDVTQAISPEETAGAVIGRYHLLQKIGEGGMGEVWLAEQKEPVRRRVAVKLIKSGMNSRELIARFQSERQALALMDHPAIAKVLDAGSTPQGTPYFVMEFVSGIPITDYCDTHRLSTRDRLELFMHVCEGVQHAHQKAIIHRDLKPSNILVTEVDGHPAPKIIDFGVAKALTQKLTADTMFTRVGAMVGTPEYMSPEQALSSGEDIDTRTDVYSLGIIFYEMLAGAPPIELRKIALDEFLRRLREDDPVKPSTRIRTQDAATSTDVARKRRIEPLALAKLMRGDLDSIALKALEKDRARRYGSPSDFAADIDRYLKDEAVLAVPPSAGYRAGKFIRRYRGALVTTCAFALVLIVASVISIQQSIRASREAASAEAVNDFLQNDVLAQASAATQAGPSAKPDPHLEVRTALDRAAQHIAGKFDRQPDVEASIRDTMGQTYMDLGLYPEARTQLERALDLHRRLLKAENPKTLKTMSRLGKTARLQGKDAEAEALLGKTVEVQRRVLPRDHPDTLYSMSNLGVVYFSQGKYVQAEGLLSQVVEIQRRVLGPDNPDTLRSMGSLAGAYFSEGKYAQAEALLSQALEIERRVLGPDHPDTLRAMGNLANVYFSEGKYAQAEALFIPALEIKRRVLGPEHPVTLLSIYNLGVAYQLQGKYAEAEALFIQALQGQRRVLGPEHPSTLESMSDLATNYYVQGKYAQAEPLFEETFKIMNRVRGPENKKTLNALENLESMYLRQGKYALAEPYAALALTGRRHTLGSADPDTARAASDLSLAYLSQGKATESEPLAREAMQTLRKNQPDNWEPFWAETLLGSSLARQKKYAEAETLLLEGYRGMDTRKEKIPVPDRDSLNLAREWIVQLYQAWGKPEKVAEWKKG